MKKIISFLLFIFISAVVYAQAVSLQATLDKKEVLLGGALRYSIQVNGTQDVEPPKLPKIDGLDIRYLGPSRNVSIVNGQYSSSISFNYSVFPTKVGTYELPQTEVNIEGETFSTRAVSFEALASTAENAKQGNSGLTNLEDKLYLVVEPEKTDVYLNESIDLSIKLYISNDLSVGDIEFPQTEVLGFQFDEFEKPRQFSQVIDGIRFNVFDFKKKITPTRLGELTFGSTQLTLNLLIESGQRRRSVFGGGLFDDPFFSSVFGRQERRPLTIEAQPVVFNVEALPDDGRPDSFTGAVGQFDFDVSVSPKDVKVGDPITLRMTLSSQSDLTAVDLPDFKEDDLFKSYPASITSAQNQKTAEQVVIPLKETIREVPAIEFSYFDPDQKKYQTITRGPFPVTVAPGEFVSAPVVGGNQSLIRPVSSAVEETFGEDIVFLKDSMGKVYYEGKLFYQQIWFLILCFVYIAAWFSCLFLIRWKQKLKYDSSYAAKIAAYGKWKKRVAKVQTLDDLTSCFNQYCSDKLQIPIGAVDFEGVKNAVDLKKWSKEDLINLKKFFDYFESIRFAGVEQNLKRLISQTRSVVDSIERRVK